MEDYESKAIRVWMRSVMATREWSANKWATMAGTSPTNITRFLNGGKFVPSSKTIGKLSYVAGSAPSLSQNATLDAASRTITLKDHLENDIGQITVYNLTGDIVAYKFNRDLPTRGVAAGDIIVVRKQKKFEENNLVLFYHKEDGELQTGKKLETNAVYQTNRNRTVKLADVRIIGRVVQIVKNLDD
jgi:hypothetical protein